MKQLVTFALILLTSAAYGQHVQKAVVYFDHAKATLTLSDQKMLRALLTKAGAYKVDVNRLGADRLGTENIDEITISGHTDADGSSSYNQKLSQARAENVYKYFTSIFNDTTKLSTFYYGEDKPVAPNGTAFDKRHNRRVEVVIKYTNSRVSTRSSTSHNLLPKKHDQTPLANKEFVQTFTVSSNIKIVITGKKGTVIRLPANSLVDKQGNVVTDDVTIELIEVYSKSDMLLNNIQTVSDQTLLETAGMVYIRITLKEQELALKDKEFYQISFPTQNKQKDMNVFYGETERRTINWKQAKGNFFSDYTYADNKKELQRYIFDTNKFGWINCDRFLNKTQTTSLAVSSTDTTGVSFCLVFKSLNSVMNVSDKRRGIRFYNVPVGETAAIVAFKKTAKNLYYSSKVITIQDNQTIDIALEKLDEKAFRERIEKFN